MDITFACPECRGSLTCDEKGIGMKIPCPHCKVLITVPPSNPPPAPKPPAPPLPVNQKAYARELFDTHSLEGRLKFFGYFLLVPLGLGILNLMDSWHNFPFMVALAVVGVAQLFFLLWMAEMLAIAKKNTGISYNPSLTAYRQEFKCTACNTIMRERLTVCPQCKRELDYSLPMTHTTGR